MKRTYIALATVCLASLTFAGLKPGDNLTPYTIENVETGKQYCQVCAYSSLPAKVVAFGKLDDEKFWADLEQLQKLNGSYKSLGVFAQVIDSKDTKAIRAKAEKHGITFPVVVAVEKDWDDAYKVQGTSRTIYYAQKNRIAWTSVGLDTQKAAQLQEQVKKDLAG